MIQTEFWKSELPYLGRCLNESLEAAYCRLVDQDLPEAAVRLVCQRNASSEVEEIALADLLERPVDSEVRWVGEGTVTSNIQLGRRK